MLQSILKSRTHINLVSRSFLFSLTKTFTYKARIQRLYNDGIDVKQQSVEIDPIEHIRRCSFYKDTDIWSFYKTTSPNVKTLGDALYEGYTVSNDGPCVGYVQSSTLEWLSYSTVIEKSRSFGAHLWTKLNLKPMQSKVAIISSNRPEYLFVEQGCYMYGFIVVSLYTTYDSTAIENILRRTEAEVLIVDNLERIQSCQNNLLNNSQLKKIFVMDEMKSDETSKIQPVSSIYKTMSTADVCERPTIDPESIATLILTSGTTGDPKLVMISHENMLAATKGNLLRLERANITKPIINRHCSFLPLAHIFERFIILQIILRGTELVFCPAPEQLIQYFSIAKPTQASVVPRVLNKIYEAVMAEAEKNRIKQFFIQQALREQPPFLSRFVFRKLRNLFGGELKGMITASAPLKPDVMHFFRIALDIPIMEGYGQTESAAAGASTHPVDMSYGAVGSPGPNAEIKLIDVPGTNYRSETNQGEVCIRGPAVFKGYYKDEVNTRETIDGNGWLHTGDIGEWTTNGTLRIIDRTKHIFKLSQGKYIAPERIEDVYRRSQWIAQIFVDGMPSESAVVAIVIPDEEYVRKHFKLATTEITFDSLCQDGKLKETILSDLMRLAKKNNLRSYEIPSNIHLHHELFSQANGLLTATLKTRRSNTRKYFQSIIGSLYHVNPMKSK